MAGNGAGDGNRKYRWRATASWNHEVARATGAACDFCVKIGATRANASQCRHGLTICAVLPPAAELSLDQVAKICNRNGYGV